MEDDERDKIITDLRIRLAKVEGEAGRAKWWQVTGGIASILGALVALLTLSAVLVNIGLP